MARFHYGMDMNNIFNIDGAVLDIEIFKTGFFWKRISYKTAIKIINNNEFKYWKYLLEENEIWGQTSFIWSIPKLFNF